MGYKRTRSDISAREDDWRDGGNRDGTDSTDRGPTPDSLGGRFSLGTRWKPQRSARAPQLAFPFASPFKPFGSIGNERRRIPVALKTALPTAGARPTMGVSPAPAEGRSLRSMRTTSIFGASLNR